MQKRYSFTAYIAFPVVAADVSLLLDKQCRLGRCMGPKRQSIHQELSSYFIFTSTGIFSKQFNLSFNFLTYKMGIIIKPTLWDYGQRPINTHRIFRTVLICPLLLSTKSIIIFFEVKSLMSHCGPSLCTSTLCLASYVSTTPLPRHTHTYLNLIWLQTRQFSSQAACPGTVKGMGNRELSRVLNTSSNSTWYWNFFLRNCSKKPWNIKLWACQKKCRQHGQVCLEIPHSIPTHSLQKCLCNSAFLSVK